MKKTLTNFLKDDHRRIQNLFQEFLSCGPDREDLAAGYLLEFYAGLMKHLSWENNVLFPALENREIGCEKEMEELYTSTDRLKETLFELKDCIKRDEILNNSLENRLARQFQDHFRRVEEEAFPELNKHLDENFEEFLYNGLRKIKKEEFFSFVPSSWFYSLDELDDGKPE